MKIDEVMLSYVENFMSPSSGEKEKVKGDAFEFRKCLSASTGRHTVEM